MSCLQENHRCSDDRARPKSFVPHAVGETTNRKAHTNQPSGGIFGGRRPIARGIEPPANQKQRYRRQNCANRTGLGPDLQWHIVRVQRKHAVSFPNLGIAITCGGFGQPFWMLSKPILPMMRCFRAMPNDRRFRDLGAGQLPAIAS